MAPEQAQGETAEIDARADVYSIGAMLYRLLSGRSPYAPRRGADDPATTLKLVRRGSPTPLARVAPDAPAELVAIAERAMARDPDDRHASVEELEAELHAFLETGVERPRGILERARELARGRGRSAT
jgi:serine/threonine-protein kinase